MLAENPTWSMDNDNIGFINIKQAQWKETWATRSVDISLNPSPSNSSAKFSATFCDFIKLLFHLLHEVGGDPPVEAEAEGHLTSEGE